MGDRLYLARRGALIAIAMLAASPAYAQSANGDAEADVITAVTLTNISDLNYGTIIPSATAGRVIVRRNNDTCRAVGGATLVGTDCHRAEFLVTGEPRERIRITTDSAPITLTRQGGGPTMVMDRIRINGNRNKRLNAAGRRTFFVSGRLRVGANQAPGTYDATFNVNVEYR